MTLALPTQVSVPRGMVELRPESRSSRRIATDARPDVVDEWGRQSFPASDPPANW